jgi:Ser/Thr protein kinase RdoA (MazF antagonist)
VTGRVVHGVAGTATLAAWPGLTRDELAPVLEAYPDLGAVRAVTWHSPRPFAASGLVACDHATVFVKRHDRRVRSQADLLEEHAFIAQLRRNGAPVPAVLQTRRGSTAPATETATYEVHALLPHADPYRDAVSWSPFASLAHARDAGRALGAMHQAAAGFTAGPRRTGLLVADFRAFGSADPISVLERRVAREPLLAAALAGRPWREDTARALLPLHARLAPHLAALPPLWTHNDFHASNLLWTGEGAEAGVAAVLDFGLSNRTCAVFDLATAIERNAIEWLLLGEGHSDIAHAELACALVTGYRAARPLSAPQARALPLILPLVHAEFALSELAYFHGVTRDAADAEAAYGAFLLGHAAWFGTPAGAALLAAVAEAASAG